MSARQPPLEVRKCRISKSEHLVKVLDLGKQSLTGVFPQSKHETITTGPLELVWCPESGLLQLGHSYDLSEMYGDNYGYRSGLNQSMVAHLQQKVKQLERLRPVQAGDFVVDIGSNDATLLAAYAAKSIRRLGIDPTGEKFRQFYSDGIDLIPSFFSADEVASYAPTCKADIVTSISMFYDLESPAQFVSDIAKILSADGIWHFEQSYMPSMLRTNAYDTVCHEHLEYYSLGVVKRLLEQHGLKIVDVQMNAVNGGSFAVTASHANSSFPVNSAVIEWMLDQEDRMGLSTPAPYRHFEERVFRHREDLVRLIRALRAENKQIVGYGASTKGNVLLQFCGFNENDLCCIAEVNPDKYGCYTPGTHIPIVSEAEARKMNPDYMLVLPWHFKDSILRREAEYLAGGGKLIFPMPDIEIV
jgi:hypothetical protein